MRKVTALVLGVLLPVLGPAGIGQAQSAVQVQGTIQAVDCQNQTIVLSGPGGSSTVGATESTAILVNSTSVSFCALGQYVGDPASAWLLPSGDEFIVTQIDVVDSAATTAPPSQAPAVSSPSPLELVIGAIAIAGLAYLVGRQSASQTAPVLQPAYQGDRDPQYGNRSQQCVRGGRNQSCPDQGRPAWSK